MKITIDIDDLRQIVRSSVETEARRYAHGQAYPYAIAYIYAVAYTVVEEVVKLSTHGSTYLTHALEAADTETKAWHERNAELNREVDQLYRDLATERDNRAKERDAHDQATAYLAGLMERLHADNIVKNELHEAINTDVKNDSYRIILHRMVNAYPGSVKG